MRRARERNTHEWMIPPPLKEPEPVDRLHAALVTASYATDMDDLKDLLHVLGLEKV